MKQKKILSNIFVYLMVFAFMACSAYAAQSAVDLGTAGNFVILAKSGISTTGTTSIVGDIGVSPIDSTAITGFGLIADSSNTFSTSSLVSGKIYASDYTPPTPATMTAAVSDMETAYTDAAGRTLPDYTELGAGNIGGMTLAPGLYKWGTGVTIPTDVTLSGNSNDVWIFQIAQDLDISSATQVILSGGAQAKNIFWQVAGQTTLGTTSNFKGNILCQTAIVLNTGATLDGRALAQTAVTLDANKVSIFPFPYPDIPLTNQQSSSTNKEEESNTETTPSTDSNHASANGNAGVSVTKTIDGETIEVTSVDGQARLKSDGIKVETKLPVKVEDNTIKVTQSNGAKAEIKVMPVVASETAIERLKLKVCTEENNCTIILKEVGVGAETKLVYQVKAQKNVKVLGLFRAKMNIVANIDAETGNVISVHKPWWSLISVDAS